MLLVSDLELSSIERMAIHAAVIRNAGSYGGDVLKVTCSQVALLFPSEPHAVT